MAEASQLPDPMESLKQHTLDPETDIRYTIDLTRGYHNLLQKEEAGTIQTYLRDGNVAAMKEQTTAQSPRTAPADLPCPPVTRYYLQDELGSPVRLLDGQGCLTETYGYDEFGQDLYGNREGTAGRNMAGSIQPFGYTGYQADRIAGTYYAQAREYRAETGRFAAVDMVEGTILIPQTQNQYTYCLNQPFRYIDPTGCTEECTEECTDNELDEIIEEGAFGYIIDGLNISNAFIGTYLKKGIVSAVRPSNIGKGIWAKIVSKDLDDVARFCGASQDDIIRGFANAKVTGLFPKLLDKIGYVGALIDAGIGIKENIEEDSSWQKTTSDAVVDVAVSGASIWAAGAAGSAIGTAVGTVVPGAGNIVGAVAGFVIGVGIYVATDVIKVKGKSIRDNIKDGISSFFGWD